MPFDDHAFKIPLQLRISKMARVAVTTTPRHNSVSTSGVSVEILRFGGCLTMFNRVSHFSETCWWLLAHHNMSMKIPWLSSLRKGTPCLLRFEVLWMGVVASPAVCATFTTWRVSFWRMLPLVCLPFFGGVFVRGGCLGCNNLDLLQPSPTCGWFW